MSRWICFSSNCDDVLVKMLTKLVRFSFNELLTLNRNITKGLTLVKKTCTFQFTVRRFLGEVFKALCNVTMLMGSYCAGEKFWPQRQQMNRSAKQKKGNFLSFMTFNENATMFGFWNVRTDRLVNDSLYCSARWLRQENVSLVC